LLKPAFFKPGGVAPALLPKGRQYRVSTIVESHNIKGLSLMS